MSQPNPDPGDPQVVATIIEYQEGLTREQWLERIARIPGLGTQDGTHGTPRPIPPLPTAPPHPRVTVGRVIAASAITVGAVQALRKVFK